MENSKKYAGLPSFLDGHDLIPIEWNGCRAYYGILPVGLIVPNTGQIDGLPANPRTWTKEELARLKKSLQETPELMLARGVLAFPDVAAENLAALGGNMRHAAAKSLKEKTVPTVVYPLDTPAEKLMEIVAKDNGTFGEFDWDALANEWSDKPLVDWGIPAWEQKKAEAAESGENGGAGGAQRQVENQEDNTDGMEVEKRAFAGAIFKLGGHMLMCGDATDAEAVGALLKTVGAVSVDLALTDPPYGVNAVDSRGICGGNPNGGSLGITGGLGKLAKSTAKPRKYAPIIGDDTTDTARAACKILESRAKKRVIFGGNYFTDFLPPSRCWVVWDKQNGDDNNFADIEMAWTDIDKPARLFAHIWAGAIREGDHEAEGRTRLHPTQKPVGLLTAIIEKLVPDAETILDPFAGSGSTVIAAERLGKRCFAMELSPEYCDVILARWERFTGKKAELLTADEKVPEIEK